ncbi:hypothetical protein AB0J40_08575 [Amycolatopsis sp. NPDC049691]|uniref:hypothetical protein n=1 Tax=Amycolatopsis sp. NPDC049691 TaxID=3155155 RepID=UPI003423CF35
MADIEVRWRRPGEKPHFFLRRGGPGGAPDGTVLAVLTALTAADEAKWSDPSAGLDCLVTTGDDVGVRFAAVAQSSGYRLTFTVQVAVQGKRCEALTFTQHFTAAGNGRLVPDKFETPRYDVTVKRQGGDDPVAQDVPVRTVSGVRGFTGIHPLLRMTGPATVLVDTEFLDVTNLWWDLHFRLTPKNAPASSVHFDPAYLAPGTHARSKRLVVLVNTRTLPMIWFASVPEAAADVPDGTTLGGYVFFRPPGDVPVTYSSTAADGLASPSLATRGMATLGRYLLSGRVKARQPDVAMLPDYRPWLAYVEQKARPLDEPNFLPCGMEEALSRATPLLLEQRKEVRVLLLPLLSKVNGYGGIPGAGLPDRAAAALRLLWCRDLVGGRGRPLANPGAITPPQPPQPGLSPSPSGALTLADDIWLGGYSAGGPAVWTALQVSATRTRVSRVIAFDPVELLSKGTDVLTATARARGAGKVAIFIAWTPNTVGVPPRQLEAGLRQAGATVTVLPEAGRSYFTMPPNPKNPWIEYVFDANRPWKDGLQPAAKADSWWHQVIVFAGEQFATDPAQPGSISFMQKTMLP